MAKWPKVTTTKWEECERERERVLGIAFGKRSLRSTLVVFAAVVVGYATNFELFHSIIRSNCCRVYTPHSLSASPSISVFVSDKLAFHWLVVATLNALCSLLPTLSPLSLSLPVLSELCLSLLLPSLERQRVLFKPLMQHVLVYVTLRNSLCAAAHVCVSVCVCAIV